jgi:hypothetical protein
MQYTPAVSDRSLQAPRSANVLSVICFPSIFTCPFPQIALTKFAGAGRHRAFVIDLKIVLFRIHIFPHSGLTKSLT